MTQSLFLTLLNRVESNWNDVVSDIYRIKGIITVIYPTSYTPNLTRTRDKVSKTISNPRRYHWIKIKETRGRKKKTRSNQN